VDKVEQMLGNRFRGRKEVIISRFKYDRITSRKSMLTTKRTKFRKIAGRVRIDKVMPESVRDRSIETRIAIKTMESHGHYG